VDLYTFSLLLGGAGLSFMALNSLGHHAGGGHSHGHGGAAHGSSHHLTHSHTISHSAGHGHAHGAPHAIREATTRSALALLSPRLLFSVLLGLGLTGLLARSIFSGIPLLAFAIAGGVLFERLAIAPLWNFLTRFASNPALTLESCVTDEATAVTTFDAQGQGLVAIEVDGQVVQVLGTLQTADRNAGIRVRAGDRVRIEEVDAGRNRCVVSAP
jgi:hypothetical protein